VRHNVTINNLLPGPFDTDRLRSNFQFNAKASGKSYEELRKARAEANPAGRFGSIEEFGDACAYLCSAQAGYITGQNLLLDGGAYRGRSDMKRNSFLIASLLCAEIACAQGYPARAVKVVVPWPPGQATDISARIVAQKAAGSAGPAFRNRQPARRRRLDRLRRGRQEPARRLHAARLLERPDLDHAQCAEDALRPLKDFSAVSLIAAAPFALVTHPTFLRRTQESSSPTCARTRTSTRSPPPAPAPPRT